MQDFEHPEVDNLEQFRSSVCAKAKIAIEELSIKMIERDEASRLIVLNLLACSNLLLIGAPGVAKSFIVKKASYLVEGARYFEHLMNFSTNPDELLGVPYKGENGEILYNTEGSVVDSEIVFIDEVFKANSEVNNSLLGVTSNYREFHQKGSSRGVVKTSTIAFFAASNEFPSDVGANPFNDRLHIRIELVRIKSPDNFKRLLRGDYDKSNEFSEKFTIDELRMVEAFSKETEIPSHIEDVIVTIKDRFIREKLESSDRKIENATRIMKVSAFCNNRTAVDVSDVLLFVHTAWNDYAERERVKSICYDSLFKSKDFFVSEIDKQEQTKQKNDNFLNNNMEDILMKRVNLDAAAIASSFSHWMENANILYENYLQLDRNFQEFLNNFEHIKNIERIVKNNLFVLDLLSEQELHIRDPYKRSFDDALVSRIESNLVSVRQSQKRIMHFIDNCKTPGDYSSYVAIEM